MTAFDRAWDIVKYNDGSIQPIGVLDNKRVVMYRGKPYYQSTGTSRIKQDDGSTAFKRKGGWYGFGGINTENRYPTMRNDWWIKGDKTLIGDKNFPQHAVLHHDPVADETGQLFYEPDLLGSMVGHWERENPDLMAGKWANVRDDQQMNELLEAQGWRVK